jgi:hypothetical protein
VLNNQVRVGEAESFFEDLNLLVEVTVQSNLNVADYDPIKSKGDPSLGSMDNQGVHHE